MTKLINTLLDPSVYGHAVDKIELLQTHISWVILTGDFAYKIKKPVNFGFLDFLSLENRRYYCKEELRLNRRFAPGLYLDVITITGKTTVSQFVLKAIPVIRIRSDIERKRLHKLRPEEKSQSGINQGIYDEEASRKTYDHLRRLTEDILLAGISVIVDGAFLQAEQRRQFAQLASILDMPYRIIDCHAEHAILEQRITERQMYDNDASEASLKILKYQQENHDPLTNEERAISFIIDSTEALAIKTVTDHLSTLIYGHTEPESFSDEKTSHS